MAAVVDPSPQAASEAQRLRHAIYADLEEMLDRAKPDGAIVAVPNQLHTAMGLACIRRTR